MYELDSIEEERVLDLFVARLASGKIPMVKSIKETLQGRYYGAKESEELVYTLRLNTNTPELSVSSDRLGSFSILRNDRNADFFESIERWMVKINHHGHVHARAELLRIATN